MSSELYRLVVCDRAGTEIAELTDAVLQSATWVLNDAGSIQYDIPQSSPQAVIPKEHQNEVQLWVPGQTAPIQWAFHEDTSETSLTASFTCPGLLAYMGGRYVTNTSYSYGYDDKHAPVGDGVDQITIAKDLWNKKSYDMNIKSYPGELSGVMRYRFYDIWDHQNLLTDILHEFPGLADDLGNLTGFDFDIYWDSSLQRYFRTYYPAKGSLKPDIMLEYGVNVTDYTNAVRGSAQSNTTYYTGGSNGDIKFENFSSATDAEIAPYGHWETIQSQSDENDIGALKQLANRYTQQRKRPLQMPQVSAVEVPQVLLGVINVGDIVPVKIKHGRTNVNSQYRIQSIEWKPGPGNLTLSFADPADTLESFSAGTWWALPATATWNDRNTTDTWNDLEGP